LLQRPLTIALFPYTTLFRSHSPLMYHDIRYVLVFLVSAFSFALEEQTYSFDLYAVVYFFLLVYVFFVLSYLGYFAAFSSVQSFVLCVFAVSFSFFYLLYVAFVLSYLGDFAAFSSVQYFEHCVVANSFSVVYLLNAALVLKIDSGFDYLIFLSIFLLAL